MKTIIYYFTGTGNSLQIARSLGERLSDCEVRSLAGQTGTPPADGLVERVGFVFPVYFWGLPRIVRRFAEALSVPQGTYCFAVVTYRGLKLDTLGLLDDILQKKGVRLSYGDGIKMPGNAINYYGPASPEKIRTITEAASVRIDEIARAVAQKEIHTPQRSGISKRISTWGNGFLYKNIAEFDKKFLATENCNGCGLCSRVCPVQNITIENKKPVWQHHCEHCMACIQWCPTEAIQYGTGTARRKRYHNPGITAKDIIEGNGGTATF